MTAPATARRLACVLALSGVVGLSSRAPAQLAPKPAQEWIKTLDSSNRVAELKIEETIARLKIKPGDVIADIGAGSGLFSVPLAQAASPGGKVYAVDIEPALLDHIAKRSKEAGLTNIQAVLGQFTDPHLPATNLDLAFINDVLHHIEHRAEYLKNLVRYLKPSGRIVLIDFYPHIGPHRNQPALQVSKEQADEWLAKLGFEPTEQFTLFKDKWFVIYAR